VNSVADMGGMDGFGPVQREPDEPVFHEPWEGRVFGMLITVALTGEPVDAFRYRLERLDPAQYLSTSYYERFLSVMEGALVEAGTLSRQEIEAKVHQFSAEPNLPVARREDPVIADNIARRFQAGNPVTRKIRGKPRFAVGNRIITRNLNPHGHTRFPRYARGKRGVVVSYHGAHVFPDSNALGLGENPQHLYTVRIAARELWGDNAEPNESVLIDLWESYLDSDRSAAKTQARGNLPKLQKLVPEAAVRAAKALARMTSATGTSRKVTRGTATTTTKGGKVRAKGRGQPGKQMRKT
jgi:nitrile hydratase subunit beta